MQRTPCLPNEAAPSWEPERTVGSSPLTVRSLSQCSAEADVAFGVASNRDGDGDADLLKTYADIYARTYGRRLSRNELDHHRLIRTLIAVEKYCDEHKYDFALYVTAQMQGLKESLAYLSETRGTRIGFQPNMMLGEKAALRYAKYVGRAARAYRAADAAVYDSTSLVGPIFHKLLADEFEAGMYYIRSIVTHRPVSLLVAGKKSLAGVVWYAAEYPEHGGAAMLGELRRKYGDVTTRLFNRARLNAAVAVVESIQSGLADMIGCPGMFTWAALGQLFREWPVTPKSPCQLAEIWQPALRY